MEFEHIKHSREVDNVIAVTTNRLMGIISGDSYGHKMYTFEQLKHKKDNNLANFILGLRIAIDMLEELSEKDREKLLSKRRD